MPQEEMISASCFHIAETIGIINLRVKYNKKAGGLHFPAYCPLALCKGKPVPDESPHWNSDRVASFTRLTKSCSIWDS